MKALLLIVLGILQTVTISFASEAEFMAKTLKIKEKAEELFKARDWKGLEDYAAEARETKEQIEMGRFVLESIYGGLAASEHLQRTAPDKTWETWYGLLDEWEREVPGSITLPAVRINFWTSFAWKARGGGWASTVEDDGWSLFKDRLKKAEDIFEANRIDANGKPFPCPGFYSLATNISLGQGWSEDRVDEEILKPIIESHPLYFLVYTNHATSLLPKWGGVDGGDYKFYLTLPDRLGDEMGNEIYAQVLLYSKINEINDYRPDLVDWEAMKKGMVGLNKRYQDSTFLTERCVTFAHRYGEQMEVLKMIEESGSKAAEEFYKSSPYGRAFELKKTSPASCLRTIRYFKPEGVLGADRVLNIVTGTDTESFIATFGYRGIGQYDLKSGNREKFFPATERLVWRIAPSPDEKWMVFTSRYDSYFRKKNSVVEVRSKDGDWAIERSSGMEMGLIEFPVFSTDSSKVIFGYQPLKKDRKKNGIYVWNWQIEGEVPKMVYPLGKKTVTRLTYDSIGESLYALQSGKLLNFDINDAGLEPKNVLDHKMFKKIWVRDYFTIEGGKRLVILGERKNRDAKLFLIDRESGDLLCEKSISITGNDAWRLAFTWSEKLKKNVIVSSGASGSLSTWTLNKGDEYSIDHQSTFPLNGQYTRTLHAITTKEGINYIVQGTKNGMLGIFKVE